MSELNATVSIKVKISNRMRTRYALLPAERALAIQFSVITADWPRESKKSLRDAIVAALDEAYAAGAKSAATAERA